MIVFSQAMPKGEAAISERITDKWMRYVDYGLSVEDFERLSDAEKQQASNRAKKQLNHQLFLKS